MLAAEYVLPLRWTADDGSGELAAYLERLVGWIDVTVVDGSPPPVFAAHAAAFPAKVRHVAPESWPGRNGKVAGVMTGVRMSRHERVVIADDDVRYDLPALHEVVHALGTADLVRPQNFFLRLPWHARWDTARSLLNRAVASDFPGTFGLRRSTLLAAGGYDGDVLFENLELIRTIHAAGGTELLADDVFVGRLPPTAGHFLGQRVRQAFDSLAQPARLALELAALPAAIALARSPKRLGILALALIALAETGRRRANGASVFASSSALWAPAWALERAVCSWIAVASRLRGGVRYGGSRLPRAANRVADIRRRIAP